MGSFRAASDSVPSEGGKGACLVNLDVMSVMRRPPVAQQVSPTSLLLHATYNYLLPRIARLSLVPFLLLPFDLLLLLLLLFVFLITRNATLVATTITAMITSATIMVAT